VFLIVVADAGVWLGAETIQSGKIGPNAADPTYIVVSTSTPVTFTSVISDSSLRKHDPLKVLIVRTDASGKPIDILGRMLDNGKRVDAKRNDHTYTVRATLNEPIVGPIYFKVAAKFSDALPRFGKDDDDDWDRDLVGLNDVRGRGNHRDRLPPLLRKLERYTFSDSITVTVDPFKLPPDPGEAGKQTIEGIDSDNDGVRDHVQRYIALTLTNSPRAQAVFTQAVIAGESIIVSSNVADDNLLLDVFKALFRANDCLFFVRGLDQTAKDYDLVRSLLLNTPARGRAWRSASQRFSGHVAETSPADQWKSHCNFNPDMFQQ